MKKIKKDTIVLPKLTTPAAIQSFLNSIPYNFEKNEETVSSITKSLKRNSIHCIEGAFIAYYALKKIGFTAYLLDLKASKPDTDHVITIFKYKNHWGAISKTNHSVLRFRDPIYKTYRELALSYFHEYFLPKNGKKTLVSFSKPFSLEKYQEKYIYGDELWDIALALDESKHFPFVPKHSHIKIRPVDKTEINAYLSTVEWRK